MLERKEIVWPGIELKEYQRAAWTKEVAEYEANPGSMQAAWNYLSNHPMFWHFQTLRDGTASSYLTDNWGFGSLAIRMQLSSTAPEPLYDVAPGIDTSVFQNHIVLEAGKIELFPREEHGIYANWHWHDIDLDCGAPTYEEAVVKLARLVWEKYGNDRRIADKED